MADETQHTLSDVVASTALAVTVMDSAAALIDGLAAKLTAAAGDPAQINQIIADLTAHTDQLKAAVVANTPAAPAPPADSSATP